MAEVSGANYAFVGLCLERQILRHGFLFGLPETPDTYTALSRDGLRQHKETSALEGELANGNAQLAQANRQRADLDRQIRNLEMFLKGTNARVPGMEHRRCKVELDQAETSRDYQAALRRHEDLMGAAAQRQGMVELVLDPPSKTEDN